MISGHTKFSPDWCFGLLKQKLRRTAVNCLADLVDVMEKSADINHAQLVGNQSGERLMPIYDWATHFNNHFKAIPNIKRFHHFHFNKASPRIVQIREFSNSPTVPLNEELAYKRGVAWPNNMWLNLVKMAGRLSVAPSLSWLLSIFI